MRSDRLDVTRKRELAVRRRARGQCEAILACSCWVYSSSTGRPAKDGRVSVVCANEMFEEGGPSLAAMFAGARWARIFAVGLA